MTLLYLHYCISPHPYQQSGNKRIPSGPMNNWTPFSPPILSGFTKLQTRLQGRTLNLQEGIFRYVFHLSPSIITIISAILTEDPIPKYQFISKYNSSHKFIFMLHILPPGKLRKITIFDGNPHELSMAIFQFVILT